jgi:pseudouridine-5'-phosphate glycosidase
MRRHTALGLTSAILFAVPIPVDAEIPAAEVTDLIAQAEADAHRAGVQGQAVTPWMLSRLADLTQGRTIGANLALIENDARVAVELAVALATGDP